MKFLANAMDRICRIARNVAAALNSYKDAPKPWGDNGGRLYSSREIVVYPERNGKWAVFGYDSGKDYEMARNLRDHVLPHGESNVRRDFLKIRASYRTFADESELSEFLKSAYGIDIAISTGFELYGIRIYNMSNGKMTDDDIKKVLDRSMIIMGKAAGRENVKKYLPKAMSFENQRYDHQEEFGNKSKTVGLNMHGGEVIAIDASRQYDDMINTIIHEVGHNIDERNEKAKEVMMRKFNEYGQKHSDIVSFEKGDRITFRFEGDELDVYEALNSFNPLLEKGVYPEDVYLRRVKNGFVVPYSKIMSCKIVRIERKNGTVSENNLSVSQYSLVNFGEFVAELFAHYCLKTLPKKLCVFMENEVIPLL